MHWHKERGDFAGMQPKASRQDFSIHLVNGLVSREEEPRVIRLCGDEANMV